VAGASPATLEWADIPVRPLRPGLWNVVPTAENLREFAYSESTKAA